MLVGNIWARRAEQGSLGRRLVLAQADLPTGGLSSPFEHVDWAVTLGGVGGLAASGEAEAWSLSC